MTRLGVNIDHVATVRQARRAPEPDPIAAAVLAELAGAHGITVHLRQDRRHIQDRDLHLLRKVITTRLNVEMSIQQEMIDIARDVQPDMVTLVPESPNEITTEGGLDVISHREIIAEAIQALQTSRIPTSLFIDPVTAQVEASHEIGAAMIEINTAAYSEAVPKGLDEHAEGYLRELSKIRKSAQLASSLGMRVLAGHGLTYRNVGPVSAIPEIEELNIGHNIVSRAVLVGMERAVREMLQAMNP